MKACKAKWSQIKLLVTSIEAAIEQLRWVNDEHSSPSSVQMADELAAVLRDFPPEQLDAAYREQKELLGRCANEYRLQGACLGLIAGAFLAVTMIVLGFIYTTGIPKGATLNMPMGPNGPQVIPMPRPQPPLGLRTKGKR